jgi:general secretion pathway protein M
MKLDSVIKRINLNKLSRREKLIVAGGAFALILFLIVHFVVSPVFERNSQLKRALQAKSAMLGEMQALQTEYQELKSKTQQSEARFKRRDKGFTLFSFLDQLAGQSGIKEHVSYMKPSKLDQKNSPFKLSRVEMKLEAVTLDQLTTYLQGVETSRNMVSVSKLAITSREQQERFLDAILQVETLEM